MVRRTDGGSAARWLCAGALAMTVAGPAAPLDPPIRLAEEGAVRYVAATFEAERGPLVVTLDGARNRTAPLVFGVDAARRPFVELEGRRATAHNPLPAGAHRLIARIVSRQSVPDYLCLAAVATDHAVPQPMDADWTVILRGVSSDRELGSIFADRINQAAGEFRDLRVVDSWAEAAAPMPQDSCLTAGRFGSGLDAATGLAVTPGDNAFSAAVLTAEAWVRLEFRQAYNIVMAHGPKRFSGHWELYTERADGAFAVYVPANDPPIIRSKRIITDGAWHHVAMVRDGRRVRLVVDGDEVANVPQTAGAAPKGKDWELVVGALHERSLRCAGRIDDVRISSVARPVGPVPTVPATVDQHTVRLWHLDSADPEGCFPDSGRPEGSARRLAPTLWRRARGVPGGRRRLVPPVRPFSLADLRATLSAAGLAVPLLVHGVRPGVLRHWGEEYEELRAILDGRLRLPPGAAGQVLDPEALVTPEDSDPGGVVLRRTRAALHSLDPAAQARLLTSAWLSRLEAAADDGIIGHGQLFLGACAVRRRLMLQQPAMDVDRLLCIARGTYSGSRLTKMRNSDAEGGHFANQYFGFNTIEAGGLYAVEHVRGVPRVKDLLAGATVENGRRKGRTLDFGSVQGPDLSFDGTEIVFAHCASKDHRWDDWTRDSTWNLFRIRADGTGLRQLTDSAWNDFDPCWLPDGRIAFVSERRGGYIRCFGAYIKVPNYVLHAMQPDGSGIVPLSVYETSEWNPSVDNDGMLVYTRWDYTDRENCLGSNAWTCYPDGRNPRAPHGNYPYPWHTFPEPPPNLPAHESRDTRRGRPYTEMGIRAIPGSSAYILTGAPHHGEAFGSLCRLDLSVPDDGFMSQLRRITPYVPFPETEVAARSQYRYGTPWALSEDLYLCNSWEDVVLLDRFGNRELLVEREILPCLADDRLRVTDPMPLRPRARPPVIPPMSRAAGGEEQRPSARICVMNVYDTDIPLPEGTTVTHLRLLQTFPKANHAMGIPLGGYQVETVPRMPLGLVPVEADGSAYFLAPPRKELVFQLVDGDGLAVHTMRSVAYVQPGEVLSCAGCHEPTHAAVGRESKPVLALGRPPSVPEPELDRLEPVSYFRQIRPLVDGLCIQCHRGGEDRGPTAMGFEDLRPYVFYFSGGMSGTTTKPLFGGSRSIPGRVGARAGRLGQAMLTHRRKGRVSDRVSRTVTLWLDANAPRLTALYREQDQIAGELVWPRLDVDPRNPLGLEGQPGENTPERIAAAAALMHPAGPERLLGTSRRFIVSDHTHDAVHLVDDGRAVWSYRCEHPQDVWMLDNGHVLVAWYRAVQEIVPDLERGEGGRVVWEYRVEAPDEIPSCQPLPGGNVLVGVCGPCVLREVDRDGAVVREVALSSTAPLHSQFRFCRKTPEGTYLVPFMAENVVREIGADGEVLKQIDWPGPVVTATRLPNGNTLVGGGTLIREYDTAGDVVWELDQDDLGYQLKLHLIAGVRRLLGGNTLVANWGTTGGRREEAQLFEVTPDFKIVWRVWDTPGLGSLAQAQILDPTR